MKTLGFTKMEGSGNDFVLIKARSSQAPGPEFVRVLCDRKFGVGADGVLFLSSSKKADIRMRIFNADGTEAQMCGNGARCAALWTAKMSAGSTAKGLTLETQAGLIRAELKGDVVRLKMTDPKDIRLDLHVKACGRDYEADYVDTGVPHAVIEVSSIEEAPVRLLGRAIRHHKIFSPAGTNVDFIQRLGDRSVLIRTYERGVEDETLACGTGSVAAAIISVLNHEGCGTKVRMKHRVPVKTRSGETLRVEFMLSKKKVFDVWLEGTARVVFEGKYPING
ncbi:MAG: diaminopimelate epimerase [Candidatus Omnitrophota bacterium]